MGNERRGLTGGGVYGSNDVYTVLRWTGVHPASLISRASFERSWSSGAVEPARCMMDSFWTVPSMSSAPYCKPSSARWSRCSFGRP